MRMMSPRLHRRDRPEAPGESPGPLLARRIGAGDYNPTGATPVAAGMGWATGPGSGYTPQRNPQVAPAARPARKRRGR